MKPHASLRMLSAAVGVLGAVGMGVAGMSGGDYNVAPETVVAPATGRLAPADDSDQLTTTTWRRAPSFAPAVIATPPPPPLD